MVQAERRGQRGERKFVRTKQVHQWMIGDTVDEGARAKNDPTRRSAKHFVATDHHKIGTVADASNGGKERGPTLDKLTERAVPLGYKAMPEDIANGILWLASDESRYVTGTELVIDGGRSIG